MTAASTPGGEGNPMTTTTSNTAGRGPNDQSRLHTTGGKGKRNDHHHLHNMVGGATR